MGACVEFRRLLTRHPGIVFINPHALGFQTMVRLLPPGSLWVTPEDELFASGPEAFARVQAGNAYLRSFFSWDNNTRMNVNGDGVVYSFSSRYITTASGASISGLKFYPTTPLISTQHMIEAVDLLARRKALFDGGAR
jgi:hypothetical protein